MDPSHIKLIPETEDAALSRVEFRLKQNVLALFPGTTCFYSSIVMSQPSRVSHRNPFLFLLLMFIFTEKENAGLFVKVCG